MNEDLEALLFDAAADDLSPEDADRLAALVEADPTIGDLLAEQRALAAAVEPPSMTELERADLHRSVRAATAAEARTPAPWARWALAAAAVVVVVVGGGFALLSMGAANNTFTNISDEIDGAPATAQADRDTGFADDAADEGEMGAMEEAAEDAAAGDGADAGGMAPVPYPACPGVVEELAPDGTDDEWGTPDEAAADLGEDPELSGTQPPIVDELGDVAVISWFDTEGTLVGQVELTLVDDVWTVSGRVACGP